MKTTPAFALTLSADEIELINDALGYWCERIEYSINGQSPPVALCAAGRTVQRRIRALRLRIIKPPLLPPNP